MTVLSIRAFFDEKKVVLVVLVLLCVTAFYLRSHNVLNRMRWSGDSARDILVSRHLAFNDDEKLLLGHTASGAVIFDNNGIPNGVLHYPTYYYSYLAILWQVLFQVKTIVMFNVLLHTLSLIGMYILVDLFSGHRWIALFTVVLFTFSHHFIDISQTIVGLQVSIPFVIFCSVLLSFGWKKNSHALTVIGVSGLTFFTTFNYALLLVLGWVMIFCLLLNRKNPLGALSLVVFQVWMFLILHWTQIIHFGWSKFVFAFMRSSTDYSSFMIGSSSQVDERVWRPLRLVFPAFHIPILLLFFVAICFLVMKRRLIPGRTITVLLFFCCVIISNFFLGLLKSGTFIESYLYYSNFMILMCIGVCGGTIIRMLEGSATKIIGCIISAVLLIGSISYGFSLRSYLDFLQWENSYEGSKKLAQKMLQEFGSPQNFGFNLSFDYSEDWESPTVGYWLEEISGEKIYSLVNYSNNLRDLRMSNKSVIISGCKIYPDQESLTRLSCDQAQSWSEANFPVYKQYKREMFEEGYFLTYLRKTEQE